MDRTEFKKRMLSLKSYRENNPGKGYWDWKVEAFDGGGETTDYDKGLLKYSTGAKILNFLRQIFNKDYRTPETSKNMHRTMLDVHTAQYGNIDKDFVPGDVFFLPEDKLKLVMEKHGYSKVIPLSEIDRNDQYGLVRTAANKLRDLGKEVPIYQDNRYSDSNISRSDVELIPTVKDIYSYNVLDRLSMAGNHPVRYYMNKNTGLVYIRGWDLNDYGIEGTNSGGAAAEYNSIQRFAADWMDKNGFPFVLTSGFVPIDSTLLYADSVVNSYNGIAPNPADRENAIKYLHAKYLQSFRDSKTKKAIEEYKKSRGFSEGGEVPPMWLLETYLGPTYNQILELLKKDDPAAYNRLAEARARALLPNSEIVRYVDANGNIATAGNAQGLQPVLTPEDLPGIGDAAEVYNIGKDFVEGNYGAAAAGLGLLAIPGGIAGKIFRKTKKLLNLDLNNLSEEELDKLYLKAIHDKDNNLVLQLRDFHFKAKAPNTKTPDTYYRHDSDNFNIFDSEKFGRHGERIGKGIYFFTDKNAVLNYGNKVRSFYVNSKNLVNDIEGPKLFGKDVLIEKFSNSKIPILKKAADNVKNADAVYGIDNSWGKPLDEYVVKESKQVKLADPITYDDNGNIIPLSKRDNFNVSDIRYSLFPLIGGATIYGLSNNDEQLIDNFEKGGEIPPDNSPVHVNPFTGKPLANGAVTPVLDLEGAANFTPIGDVLSIRDMYVAARNRDLLGLGLAGLGILPFMSRIRPIDRPPIPTVNKDAIQRLIDLSVSQTDKNKKVLDDFYNLRNSVYESLIENEDAFRRAARADRRSGTSYMLTYLDMVKEYGRDGSNLNPNLAQPGYDRSLYEQPVKAQVSTSNPDLIRLNPRYKDPEELDETFLSLNPGLIRHEMGHSADIKSGLGYTRNLADPSKFEPESKIKEMYPKSYRTILDYLLNGSEIKSHMNEFRDFLFNKGEYLPKETINSIRKKLDKYGSLFKNLNILFDLYKNKRLFVNDYNLIPITATENNDNLV